MGSEQSPLLSKIEVVLLDIGKSALDSRIVHLARGNRGLLSQFDFTLPWNEIQSRGRK